MTNDSEEISDASSEGIKPPPVVPPPHAPPIPPPVPAWAQYGVPRPPPYPSAIPFAEPLQRSPPQKRWPASRIAAIAAIVTVACAIVGGVIYDYQKKHRDLPGRAFESQDQKRRDTTAAFALGPPQPINLPPQDLVSIQALFDRLSQAAARSDARTLAAAFDYDRMADEIVAGGNSELVRFRNDKSLQQGIESGFKRSFSQPNSIFEFKSCQVRQVRSWPGNPNEIVVYLTTTESDGVNQRTRWWLRRDGFGWRIWDFEDVRLGLRSTQMVSAAFANGTAQDQRTQSRLQTASASLRAGRMKLIAGDYAGAQPLLQSAADPALPGSYEALRLVSLAICSSHNGKHAEALALAEQSTGYYSDLPLTDLVKADAHVGTGNFGEGASDLDRYEAAVGPDFLSCNLRGKIALSKFQREVAAKAFRDGLEDNPKASECFVGLARSIGIGGIAELRTRFARLSDGPAALPLICEQSIQQRDTAALEAAVTLYRDAGLLQTDPWAAYADAELHVLRHDWNKAVAAFESHLDLLRSSTVTRGVVDEEYGLSLIAAGQPLKGYGVHPDKAVAIESAGDYLISTKDAGKLDELIKAHRLGHANDTLHLEYLTGSSAELRQEYETAEKHFRLALDNAVTDEWRSRLSTAVVRMLFYRDKIEEAFNTIGPQKQTVSTLSGLAHIENKPQVLRKIADLYQAQSAGNPLANWYRADAAWMEKDFASCAQMLRTSHEKFDEKTWPGFVVPDRLVRSLIRTGKAAEALQVVQECERNGRNLDYLHALAAAAAADLPDATQRLDRLLTPSSAATKGSEDEEDDALTLAMLQEDEDFAKLLASPALADWLRKRQAAETKAVYPQTRPAPETK